ncbi:MAG: LacI family DNA-binding transcriptional regulator [Pseudomonadota bacterium]
MKKTGSTVTMREVARAAGVSRMTVSRALKKDSPVSHETRERILKVVREMNYVPDQMAGSLATKKSGFVAVLVPSLNNLHFAVTIQALTDELEQIGQQILLGHTDYSATREEQLVETMLRRRPEAVILSYDGHTDRTVRLLEEAHAPVIELWERPAAPIAHTVGFSNRTAAVAMTKALIDRGYRRLVFLGEADDDFTRGGSRREGFIAAMRDAGLPTHRVFRSGKPPLSIEDGAAAASEVLARFPDVDCIFCVSDAPAFGVQSALLSQGVSVPDQIGVAGFGNFEVSRHASPSISTVVVDPRQVGRQAGQLAVRLLASAEEDEVIQHIGVCAEPELRGSTASRG